MGQETRTVKEQALEHFDEPKELDRKVTMLADMIKKAKGGIIALTGAGISTAAGIPDYRSPAQTVVPTGPGKWETEANIQQARKDGTLKHEPISITEMGSLIQNAKPTLTHMALFKLMEQKKLTDIISSNFDPLHAKSGIPSEQLHELFGNVNVE